MTLEELGDWIDHLNPPPLVDGVSMLDGYMTAIIVGPCSISNRRGVLTPLTD
jgi:uncharacterized protein